ncbi:MAG: glycogen synthase GlgA [Candidatus Omnitrophica bacterium]|nr:glycogen synthase GlgA [Candidatus Omnitrophota bacterium]
MDKKKVAIVSCEMVPLMKVGGLADVTGSLYKKLNQYCDVSVFMPAFPQIKKILKTEKVSDFTVSFSPGRNEKVSFLKSMDPKYPALYLIDNEIYFNRQEPYGKSGVDYPDNPERFSFFCKGVLEACRLNGLQFDVFHCHDWQTALLPLYLNEFYNDIHSKSVFTIHNLAYQGKFPKEKFSLLGLNWKYFNMEELEFYGSVNIMKAGIIHSEIITTVSPTYSKEILTSEYGCGLEGLLSKRKESLYGIINGIDYQLWNPVFDPFITKKYKTRKAKIENKKALQKKLNLSVDEKIPLLGFVGRLVQQKGTDLIVDAIKNIIGTETFQVVVLGTGEAKYETQLKEMALNYPGRISITFQFNDHFARQIYAGSDFFLMPSRFEPCGLGQLISMKYGTIPIVRKTGGLADTVKDFNQDEKTGWGIVFEEPVSSGLQKSIQKAIDLYNHQESMDVLFNNARNRDFSWNQSIKQYWEIYQKAVNVLVK